MNRSTWPSAVTSTTWVMTSALVELSSAAAVARRSSPRAQMDSRQPSAASPRAIARPSPRLAPVTEATFPLRPKSTDTGCAEGTDQACRLDLNARRLALEDGRLFGLGVEQVDVIGVDRELHVVARLEPGAARIHARGQRVLAHVDIGVDVAAHGLDDLHAAADLGQLAVRVTGVLEVLGTHAQDHLLAAAGAEPSRTCSETGISKPSPF